MLLTQAIQGGGAKQSHRRLHPLSCAGIEAGGAHDADVVKKYGKGYFVPDESHGGGRYFVDPNHRVTLHTEIGTDEGIDGIEYQQGVHLPHKPTAKLLKAAETPQLTGDEKIDNVLPLGATVHDVRARYGKPDKDTQENGERTLAYNGAESKNTLGIDVNFSFRKGKLVRVYFDVGD